MRKTNWEWTNEIPGLKEIVRDLAEKIVVKNTRGPMELHAAVRRGVLMTMYPQTAEVRQEMLNCALGPEEIIGDKCPIPHMHQQWCNSTTMAKYVVFQKCGAPIYKIASEFGAQLEKVDLNIRASLLPERDDVYCIEFPDGMQFIDRPFNEKTKEIQGYDDYFQCAYVCVQRNNRGVGLVDRHGKTIWGMVSMLFPSADQNGEYRGEENSLTLTFYSPDEPLGSSFERAKLASTQPMTNRKLTEFVLKCMVYIASGDPDLRNYRPPKMPATSKAKKLRAWEREHAGSPRVPMTLVGFDFKKPVIYRVDETSVTGHFRWQPFGAGREKVKLIWIEEHLRRFNQQEHKP